MNKNEEAYCKHDLNILSDGMLSDMATLFTNSTKYSFNGCKKELTEYAKEMKMYRLYNKSDCPCDKFSADGKILYTENLFHTINYHGFNKIAKLLGDYDCIAIIGSNLQIGNIIYSDTDAFYFKGHTILGILQEKWGNHTECINEALKLAGEDYSSLIDEELRLGIWMCNLGVDALVNIYSVVEI